MLPLPQRIDYLLTGVAYSPRERIAQCNMSARSVEPNITQTDNQIDQPRLESTRNEAMEIPLVML